MKPRDFTARTWRRDYSGCDAKSGLFLSIDAYGMGASLGFTAPMGLQVNLVLPRSIMGQMFDWVCSLKRTDYEEMAFREFGKRVAAQERVWSVGISCQLDKGNGKIVTTPASVTIHANGRNGATLFCRLEDLRELIQWYNTEIPVQEAA